MPFAAFGRPASPYFSLTTRKPTFAYPDDAARDSPFNSVRQLVRGKSNAPPFTAISRPRFDAPSFAATSVEVHSQQLPHMSIAPHESFSKKQKGSTSAPKISTISEDNTH